MYFQHNRKAFSMVTAIFVIVIMASVSAIVLSLSGKLVKETTSQFQREQSMLLAKSYTEYAIMAVMANDRNTTGNCLQTIESDDVFRPENSGGFVIRVEIAYLSNGTGVLAGCPTTTILSDAVTTIKSPLNIIVDVYVKYLDFDNTNTTGAFITYHKRTLQKI